MRRHAASRFALIALVSCLAPQPARAGPMTGLGDAAAPSVSSAVERGLSLAIIAGPGIQLLGSASNHGVDLALGVDFTFAIFDDEEASSSPLDRLRHPGARTRWPWLSHPILELNASAVIALSENRQQACFSIGTGIGPVGVGLAMALETRNGSSDFATAFGPELRVRHRFGPAERSPSVALFLRGELFVIAREAHADRITVGIGGMLDVL